MTALLDHDGYVSDDDRRSNRFVSFMLTRTANGQPLNEALADWMELVILLDDIWALDADAIDTHRRTVIDAFLDRKKWCESWQKRHDAIEALLRTGLTIRQAADLLYPDVSFPQLIQALFGHASIPYAEQYAALDTVLVRRDVELPDVRKLARQFGLPRDPIGVRRLLVLRDRTTPAYTPPTKWSEEMVDEAIRLRAEIGGTRWGNLDEVRAALADKFGLGDEFTKNSVMSLYRRADKRGRDTRTEEGRDKWRAGSSE